MARDVPPGVCRERGIGAVCAADTLRGRPIAARYVWSRITPQVAPVAASVLARRRESLEIDGNTGLTGAA